ncbi:arylsulfatase [Rhodopseudomonas sp. BR0G17]|uniref:arylsulfatase n=1 Tax=Rhodopseudomonas sp. BR0G17 TaxID=2269368 RepID=UPI0013E028D5|nr:arylsulfatase [Rhodopseudomonas sp. BR0G17]NEW97133.1 arylsulfatase [Rhodopseudomonas sp. BR0G17]
MSRDAKNTEADAKKSIDRRKLLLGTTTLVATAALTSQTLAQAQKAAPAPSTASGGTGKPNILLIRGDDIGWFNVSAYNMGIMGYRTPNIDRIGREGAVFTDWYGQQSCTAGRAAFITGQTPVRTGLTKVGLPGAELGLGPLDPSVADVLKTYGYASGQFGKNHLGDRDEHLPTAHGFDEFFGNLYHLNAEEEPENPDYPKHPSFVKKFGPRGVIKSSADGKIENTGPLNTKRMETIDEEFLGAAKDFINHRANKPWFCYFNSTRMQVFTHLKKESQGKTGKGIYPDGMVETDGHVGELLKLVDDLGVADNTIVVYTTDNGAEVFTWPDGGATPFKGEKATNWEGGSRVPCLIKWPGVIKPGTIINDICVHEDFIPTFAAANGDVDLVERTKKGTPLNGKQFKVHFDGFNLLPFLKGEAKESPRSEFLYWSDDGDLMALRVRDWKIAFTEQNTELSPQTPISVWQGQFTKLRVPNIYNLRADPFERATTSLLYGDWQVHHAFLAVPAQAVVARYIESFKEFPPRAKAASFTVSDVMEKLTTAGANKN